MIHDQALISTLKLEFNILFRSLKTVEKKIETLNLFMTPIPEI
jgi:hypothetical protein